MASARKPRSAAALGMVASAATVSPLSRYADATSSDGWLTSFGWRRLAADLDTAAARSTGETATKLRDRAADCRARARRMEAP